MAWRAAVQEFARFGKLAEVKAQQKAHYPYCFVNFYTTEDAVRAKDALRVRPWDWTGGRREYGFLRSV